ncbi:TonB-dependent receptor [Cellvibrio japonicus]|uniref:TonB-dependent receptor n=1 Tax=Cellvibrio japonicus (strain Ueda107) TaxID=498211 RepID=B3PK71_CELJU|nr:TonB-dependent receptor [Cellvibrio japonicus]ACE84712.1 TonB-dependent receptor [Cellvibrio japonicus Ueda107]QEI11391.1 TonB-dependent receptor [Cellvibrio japonicus]QEI14965.1 TonB-dependent receptor [Cellvibrio japonicus]QEI18545.1 TonB-dependent receptor [Cellvibrio japonicus]
MRKLKFNHMLALASTVALVSGSQTVYAQQQDASAQVEEVVVTGFRASLANSISAKRESASVIDSVYAEDIGKLPDTSIAESLARLPGLAGERRDGRTSGIAIRGFNENYVATTLNGREILGIGDSRGVEFDLYPSEMLSGVDVYKTPNATQVNQGLGGIVNMKTLRPLDGASVISLSGAYEVNGLKSSNPDVDDNGHRLAFTYSEKFVDETLGVALTLATLESPSQEEQFRAWGYTDDGAGNTVLGGHDSYVRSSLMERDTISGVVQFRPNDTVSVTVDGLYIDFSETKVLRGLEEGTVWGGPSVTNVTDTVENGLVTAGHWDGFHSVIRNDGETKEGKLHSFGVNADFAINDNWSLNVDLSTSESEKEIISMESYSGTGRAGTTGQGAPAARSFVMTSTGVKYSAHPTLSTPDYSDPSVLRIAGPQAWGGGISSLTGGFDNAQDGFVNSPSIEESLDAFRIQFNGDVEWGIVNGLEVGAHYSDRSKSKVNYGAYLVAPGFYQADGSLPSDISEISDIAIPAEYIVGTADLSFLSLGSMVAYDGIGLYKSGFYREIDAGNYETDRKGDTYTIDEKVATAFVMANIDAGQLTGNAGIQIVSTDQKASGFDSVPVAPTADGTVQAVAVSDGDKYTDILPSLNLTYALTDDQNIRLAVARTMSRAVMDDLKPGRTVTFSFDAARRASNDPEFSAWSSTSGNAQLKPIKAVQIDLAYEYYFARDGLFSIAGFYKDLQNWHLEGSETIDFTSYFVPGYHDANMPGGTTFASFWGGNSSVFETNGGSVSGYEVQASIPFHLFSDALDGFGIIASGTFLDSTLVHNGESSDIPGFSDESYQFTAYYERAGFEARISGRKRTKFLTEVPGLSLRATPAMDMGAELWDAQIGYNFAESGIRGLEGLTVTLQAQNIFDEDTVNAESGDARRVTKYQNFGANYLLGFNYKF